MSGPVTAIRLLASCWRTTVQSRVHGIHPALSALPWLARDSVDDLRAQSSASWLPWQQAKDNGQRCHRRSLRTLFAGNTCASGTADPPPRTAQVPLFARNSKMGGFSQVNCGCGQAFPPSTNAYSTHFAVPFCSIRINRSGLHNCTLKEVNGGVPGLVRRMRDGVSRQAHVTPAAAPHLFHSQASPGLSVLFAMHRDNPVVARALGRSPLSALS